MPELLQPDTVRFTLTDGAPGISLAVDAPESPGPWTVVVMVTFLTIDGPGDLGFLIPRFGPAAADVPPAWETAVTTSGGVHIRFGAAPPVFARHLTA